MLAYITAWLSTLLPVADQVPFLLAHPSLVPPLQAELRFILDRAVGGGGGGDCSTRWSTTTSTDHPPIHHPTPHTPSSSSSDTIAALAQSLSLDPALFYSLLPPSLLAGPLGGSDGSSGNASTSMNATPASQVISSIPLPVNPPTRPPPRPTTTTATTTTTAKEKKKKRPWKFHLDVPIIMLIPIPPPSSQAHSNTLTASTSSSTLTLDHQGIKDSSSSPTHSTLSQLHSQIEALSWRIAQRKGRAKGISSSSAADSATAISSSSSQKRLENKNEEREGGGVGSRTPVPPPSLSADSSPSRSSMTASQSNPPSPPSLTPKVNDDASTLTTIAPSINNDNNAKMTFEKADQMKRLKDQMNCLNREIFIAKQYSSIDVNPGTSRQSPSKSLEQETLAAMESTPFSSFLSVDALKRKSKKVNFPSHNKPSANNSANTQLVHGNEAKKIKLSPQSGLKRSTHYLSLSRIGLELYPNQTILSGSEALFDDSHKRQFQSLMRSVEFPLSIVNIVSLLKNGKKDTVASSHDPQRILCPFQSSGGKCMDKSCTHWHISGDAHPSTTTRNIASPSRQVPSKPDVVLSYPQGHVFYDLVLSVSRSVLKKPAKMGVVPISHRYSTMLPEIQSASFTALPLADRLKRATYFLNFLLEYRNIGDSITLLRKCLKWIEGASSAPLTESNKSLPVNETGVDLDHIQNLPMCSILLIELLELDVYFCKSPTYANQQHGHITPVIQSNTKLTLKRMTVDTFYKQIISGKKAIAADAYMMLLIKYLAHAWRNSIQQQKLYWLSVDEVEDVLGYCTRPVNSIDRGIHGKPETQPRVLVIVILHFAQFWAVFGGGVGHQTFSLAGFLLRALNCTDAPSLASLLFSGGLSAPNEAVVDHQSLSSLDLTRSFLIVQLLGDTTSLASSAGQSSLSILVLAWTYAMLHANQLPSAIFLSQGNANEACAFPWLVNTCSLPFIYMTVSDSSQASYINQMYQQLQLEFPVYYASQPILWWNRWGICKMVFRGGMKSDFSEDETAAFETLVRLQSDLEASLHPRSQEQSNNAQLVHFAASRSKVSQCVGDALLDSMLNARPHIFAEYPSSLALYNALIRENLECLNRCMCMSLYDGKSFVDSVDMIQRLGDSPLVLGEIILYKLIHSPLPIQVLRWIYDTWQQRMAVHFDLRVDSGVFDALHLSADDDASRLFTCLPLLTFGCDQVLPLQGVSSRFPPLVNAWMRLLDRIRSFLQRKRPLMGNFMLA